MRRHWLGATKPAALALFPKLHTVNLAWGILHGNLTTSRTVDNVANNTGQKGKK